MANFDDVWARIERYAGQTFTTATGLPFTYRVPGDYLKVSRDGREINRSLSRTNFMKASNAMPTAKPSDIKDKSGVGVYLGHLDGPTHSGRRFIESANADVSLSAASVGRRRGSGGHREECAQRSRE